MSAPRGRQITNFGGFLGSPFAIGSSFKAGILKKAYLNWHLGMPSASIRMEIPSGDFEVVLPSLNLNANIPSVNVRIAKPSITVKE
jgi:hypothetical protein